MLAIELTTQFRLFTYPSLTPVSTINKIPYASGVCMNSNYLVQVNGSGFSVYNTIGDTVLEKGFKSNCVIAAVFSSDGELMVLFETRGEMTLKTYDVTSGESKTVLSIIEPEVTACELSKSFMGVIVSNILHVYDIRTGERIKEVDSESGITCVRFTETHALVLTDRHGLHSVDLTGCTDIKITIKEIVTVNEEYTIVSGYGKDRLQWFKLLRVSDLEPSHEIVWTDVLESFRTDFEEFTGRNFDAEYNKFAFDSDGNVICYQRGHMAVFDLRTGSILRTMGIEAEIRNVLVEGEFGILM
jgi:hypothetical protein